MTAVVFNFPSNGPAQYLDPSIVMEARSRILALSQRVWHRCRVGKTTLDLSPRIITSRDWVQKAVSSQKQYAHAGDLKMRAYSAAWAEKKENRAKWRVERRLRF